MNIKLIKQDLEYLNRLIGSWSEGEIAVIEQDMALEKLKNIYNEVKFAPLVAEFAQADVEPTEIAGTTEHIADSQPLNEQDSEEQEVEVEFIFDEENLSFDGLDVLFEDEPAEEDAPQESVAIAEPEEEIEPEEEDIKEEQEIEPQIVTEEQDEIHEPALQQVEEPQTQTEIEIIPEPIPEEPEVITSDNEKTPFDDYAISGSLFGDEDIPRKSPKTKHQRMMSIYNEVEEEEENSLEKSVDISKIFELDIDEDPQDEPVYQEPKDEVDTIEQEEEFALYEQEEQIAEFQDEEESTEDFFVEEQEPQTQILADVIAPNTPTLADTIEAPTALADEMVHTRIRSLRDGIGINDKFLMIKDLFDGDADQYDNVISELDAMDSFDDCMIYIVENFAWDPNTDGAKFIMKLLERKLS